MIGIVYLQQIEDNLIRLLGPKLLRGYIMNLMSTDLAPKLDELGRWYWPDPDCECVRLMRRAGRFRMLFLPLG